MAEQVELTVDGLGPRGGHAHHPDEFVDPDSVEPRAAIALAFAAAALARGSGERAGAPTAYARPASSRRRRNRCVSGSRGSSSTCSGGPISTSRPSCR